MVHVSMTVNGRHVSAEVDPRTLLVQFLRENLRLTGTHVGCDTSQCGACVVHVDGEAIKSCTTLAASCDGRERHDDRGPRPGRQAASDAAGVPGQSRPAVRLLHAGHDHGVGRPGQPRGLRPRRGRRSGTDSKATSAAAPATTTSSRRSPRARAKWAPPRRPRPPSNRDRSRSSQGENIMSATGIGASVKRKEDIRFITGKGHYVDDINRPGQAYAYFLRSPHAHATIDKIDAVAGAEVARASSRSSPATTSPPTRSAASSAAWTDPLQGRLADEGRRPSGARPWQGALRRRSTSPSSSPTLTRRRATRRRRSMVDYDVLPAVVDPAKAPTPAQPQIHDAAPNNTVFNWHLGDKAATDAAFAARGARDEARPRQQPH